MSGAFLALLIGYFSTVNYLEPGEAGITWNPVNGEIGIQDHPGYQVNAPWEFVTTIETRPQRVCIQSPAHAAVNCRLVQFDTRYYREFVAAEGWRWYWWSNRLSFNSGYDTYRGWRSILYGYAFSSQQYRFIRTITEYD
jgi:hypothetical protein